MQSQILLPVVALAAWTLVMAGWMLAARIPAMRRAGFDPGKAVGTSGPQLRMRLAERGEDRASWPADNYNHLHEQPTVFYAVALVLAIIGAGNGLNATIAWVYVGARVAHSIVQAAIGRVALRFACFFVATLALAALVLHAALTLLH